MVDHPEVYFDAPDKAAGSVKLVKYGRQVQLLQAARPLIFAQLDLARGKDLNQSSNSPGVETRTRG
jgi:hypothetical protein